MVRKAPNYLILVSALIAVAISFNHLSSIGLLDCLIGGLLGLAIFYYPYTKGFIGAGDTKLFMLVGMFLGPALALWAYLLSCLVGGFIGLFFWGYQTILRKSIFRFSSQPFEMNLPYGIAIFLGTVMTIFNFQKMLLNA